MVIDIRTIPAGHSVVKQETGLDEYAADLPRLVAKVSCEAAIDRNGSECYVRLRFESTLEMSCSRCLKEFLFPVSGETRLVIKERQSNYGKAPGDDDADFFYDSRHLDIDLGPVLFEEILTSLPLKPLCTPECEGITVESDVQKEDAAVDPRWEALKKLKERQM
ncbi:MAG: DUF177 domain-containing protein [Chitinispirillaceae bacterium]|nr:DUF177 domain-containing protein [Chitinispirillaceae bacterium]